MSQVSVETFTELDAHRLGEAMRVEALSNNWPIVIDIRAGETPLYSVMLPGATAENFDWARRKRNLTLLTGKDTWQLAQLRAQGKDPIVELGLDEKDYASHGGCIPIFVGDQIVATVTVSGLPQKDDHDLAYKHLEALRTDAN
jgi:uncharacterized protein (UPF0303 family)